MGIEDLVAGVPTAPWKSQKRGKHRERWCYVSITRGCLRTELSGYLLEDQDGEEILTLGCLPSMDKGLCVSTGPAVYQEQSPE